ncbi:hypothetical protein V6N13_134477 [Hibiscus sabdariffa]
MERFFFSRVVLRILYCAASEILGNKILEHDSRNESCDMGLLKQNDVENVRELMFLHLLVFHITCVQVEVDSYEDLNTSFWLKIHQQPIGKLLLSDIGMASVHCLWT